ncbi:MAG: hypothetical protein WDO68_06195 [Gammaproteobacteria bacterium]
MPLPTGTTFVSATGGGVLEGRDVHWSLDALRGISPHDSRLSFM